MKYSILLILAVLLAVLFYDSQLHKLLNHYLQLNKEHVSYNKDQQLKSQKSAHYVGSNSCKECHEEEYSEWHSSRHSFQIQNVKENPDAVVADFLKLPADANFELEDITYTIGGKFKQRYMIRSDENGTENYILANKQWNSQTQQWQEFKPWKYWYKDVHPNNFEEFKTAHTCDGCHFVGYMSQNKRVEPSTGCESCHGPASEHVKNPESLLYKASEVDSARQNEVCLQCHMRNRDKRLESKTLQELYKEAKDYPAGYEPGKPLVDYKLNAPFTMGIETKEFYANGAAKKNRSQGNEYVHSIMSKHGITCINCHDHHKLTNTKEDSQGNALCMSCHTFGGAIGPHEGSLSKHTKHKADSKGSLCVECHMPKTGKHTSKSPLTVRSHMFGFTSPKQTLDYKMPKETNACYACHTDKTLQELQEDLERWGNIGWDKR